MVPEASTITQTLDTAVASHTKRKDEIRRLLWSLKIATMLCGLVSTILLGYTFAEQASLTAARNAALVTSALGTFLAGLTTFWNLDSYWLRRKVTLERLVLLREQWRYRIAAEATLTSADADLAFDHYLRIIAEQADYWEGVLKGARTGVAATKTAETSSDT